MNLQNKLAELDGLREELEVQHARLKILEEHLDYLYRNQEKTLEYTFDDEKEDSYEALFISRVGMTYAVRHSIEDIEAVIRDLNRKIENLFK